MTARLTVPVQSRLEVLAVAAEACALAQSEGLDSRKAGELTVVIAELATNALRHGGGAGLVLVSVSRSGWTVEVKDGGPGLSDAVLADNGHGERQGRDGCKPTGAGLASVRRLSSHLELSNRDGGGACALARKHFTSRASPEEEASP